MTKNLEQLNQWNQHFEKASPIVILEHLQQVFGTKICLASSLGLEDQLLTYFCNQLNQKIDIFILDTLRLHPETYSLMHETEQLYQFSYKVYQPDETSVETFIKEKGLNSFYDSIENRKLCCGIRKVEPLARALKGKKAWVTGLRREQSVTRSDLALFEWDSSHNCIKVNPLKNWSFDETVAYIDKHNIPKNALHQRGYPSIGCEPCTRAIKPGEDIRAGRWWWEQADSKECGLHAT